MSGLEVAWFSRNYRVTIPPTFLFSCVIEKKAGLFRWKKVTRCERLDDAIWLVGRLQFRHPRNN